MRTMRPLTAAGATLAACAATLTFGVPTAHAVEACDGKAATIVGTPDDDRLTGTDAADVVVLLGGDDVFRGGAGNDVICGGAGADFLFGEDGNDRVFGGDGADTLSGATGDDVLRGEGSLDRVLGLAGHDDVDGGDDRTDTIDFMSSDPDATQGAVIDAAKGTYSFGLGSGKLRNFEVYIGTESNDVFRGTDARDNFRGQTGNDRVWTYGKQDIVQIADGSIAWTGDNSDLVTLAGNAKAYGEAAGDRFLLLGGKAQAFGQSGADTFNITTSGDVRGGKGRDALVLHAQQGDSGVSLDLRKGVGRWPGDPDKGTFTVKSVQRVTGTKKADTLRGTNKIDIFYGGDGNDRFFGRGGADRFYGEKHTDKGVGGKGDDLCDVEIAKSCRRPNLG